MNLTALLADLHAQRDQIDAAVAALARLAGETEGAGGRPPAWMKDAASATPGKRKGRTFTDAQRREASLRMKKRWAAKKKTVEKN